jgi:hypothetical protein
VVAMAPDSRSRPTAKQGGSQDQDKIRDNSTSGEFPGRDLADWRRADLHASAITDQAIAEAGVRDDPKGRGWVLPWSDGVDSIDLLVYDRDKRPKDDKGKEIKSAWPSKRKLPAGLIVNVLRDVPGADKVLVVEGVRQQLAALSHAPADGAFPFSVYGMNGCDGIHEDIADRLPALFEGKQVRLIFDADWHTNERVNLAATRRVPKLLNAAGARSVALLDIPGEGKDGLDDVLGQADNPAAVLRQMITHPTNVKELAPVKDEAADKRAQAILDATLDAEDLDQLPEPVPILAGYLNESEAVWLAGKFGTYKTMVALAWSYSVATGRPWSGAEVKEPRPVVYVAAEGVTGLRRRLRALERYHGQAVPRGMLTVIRRPVHLERPEEVAALRQVIERTGARLVVLDTWHRMAGRAEENSNTEQGEPIDVALACATTTAQRS